jgi:hypothetical protein
MDDGLVVPGDPDGMAAFPGPGRSVVLVRNHELDLHQRGLSAFGKSQERLHKLAREAHYDSGRGDGPSVGGTTTLVYDLETQRVTRQWLSLAGTQNNCSGGPTPWKSFITCEEDVSRVGPNHLKDHGFAFEVPARAQGGWTPPRPFLALGRFRREAVAVDPQTGVVYQTEDRPDGLFYRFIPNVDRDWHAGGRLQALCVRDAPGAILHNGPGSSLEVKVGEALAVSWVDLQDVQSPDDDLRARGHQLGAAQFSRSEGIWWGDGLLYFCATTGGPKELGQIWTYRPSRSSRADNEEKSGELSLFVQSVSPELIENGDNLTVSPHGGLFVCEDGPPSNGLVWVTPQGVPVRFARNAKDDSELCGCVFSPDGSVLFLNMQTTGYTLALTGPWERLAEVLLG